MTVISSRLERASYRVALIGSRFVDVGAMRLGDAAGATLHLDSRRAALPGGISDLQEFGGGRIEVRRGSTIVLSAPIPHFQSQGHIAVRGVRGNSENQRSIFDSFDFYGFASDDESVVPWL